MAEDVHPRPRSGCSAYECDKKECALAYARSGFPRPSLVDTEHNKRHDIDDGEISDKYLE